MMSSMNKNVLVYEKNFYVVVDSIAYNTKPI